MLDGGGALRFAPHLARRSDAQTCRRSDLPKFRCAEIPSFRPKWRRKSELKRKTSEELQPKTIISSSAQTIRVLVLRMTPELKPMTPATAGHDFQGSGGSKSQSKKGLKGIRKQLAVVGSILDPFWAP